MVTICSLISLLDGLTGKVLGHEESVDFSFKDPNSFGQDVRFGGKFRELGVFKSKFLLTQHEGSLGQL